MAGFQLERAVRDVVEQLSAEEKAVYRALVRVMLAAPRVVSAELGCESDLGLSDCTALEALAEAPGCQMRMAELAVACGVSISGITRIMDRLNREGLTRRTSSPGDGRGSMAVLTAAGRASLELAQPTHLASIRRHIFDHLGDVDLAPLASSMDRIAESLVAAETVTRRSRKAPPSWASPAAG
jgi:DNA-binding MarR family transcriptional regulator